MVFLSMKKLPELSFSEFTKAIWKGQKIQIGLLTLFTLCSILEILDIKWNQIIGVLNEANDNEPKSEAWFINPETGKKERDWW